MQQTKLIKQKW